MVRFLHVKDFDGVDGGASLPFHSIKEFSALNKLVFSHYERNADVFDLHFDTSDKSDACEFPVSKALWDSGEYLPRSDSDTLVIFAHFVRRSHARRARNIREPHEHRPPSNMEHRQHYEKQLRTLPTERDSDECDMRNSQNSQDQPHLNIDHRAQQTIYGYKDLDPSIQTTKVMGSGRTSILVGYLQRAGYNKNIIYASPVANQKRIERRAARLDIHGQYVGVDRKGTVSHADTVYFSEFASIADDHNALYSAICRATEEGLNSGGRHGTDRSVSPLLSERTVMEFRSDCNGMGDSTQERPFLQRQTKTPPHIRTRLVLKKGTGAIFRDWEDVEVDLPADIRYEGILSVVQSQLYGSAGQSDEIQSIRDHSQLEIHLGPDEHSLRPLERDTALSCYAAPMTDNATELLAHVRLFLSQDGSCLQNLQGLHHYETGHDRQNERLPSSDADDTGSEEEGAMNRPRRYRGSASEVIDLSFEDVHISFLITGRGEAASRFKSFSDLHITLDADATYTEVKDSLRPYILSRLKRSKTLNDLQLPEHISFEFTLSASDITLRTSDSELIPLSHGQSLREFVLEAGTSPRLTGEIIIAVTQTPPPRDGQDDVFMADVAAQSQPDHETTGTPMQGNIDYPEQVLGSVSGSQISSSSSPASPFSTPPASSAAERDQECNTRNDPIELWFTFHDQFRRGGKPFVFKTMKWDVHGEAEQREIRHFLKFAINRKMRRSRQLKGTELVRKVAFDVDIDNGRSVSRLSPGRALVEYLDTQDSFRKLTARVLLRRKEEHEL